MFYVQCVLVFVFITIINALPAKDVEIVESTIREVRAVAPDDLLLAATNYGHDYGADDDGSVGYLKRTEDGGSDGYKHFDSYHKKDGDNYGYEKHTAFGKADKANHDSADDGDEKQSYQVAEEVNEDGEVENFEPSENYTDEGNAEEHYTEGEGDGESEHYTAGEGADYGYDDGESEKLTEEEAEESDDY